MDRQHPWKARKDCPNCAWCVEACPRGALVMRLEEARLLSTAPYAGCGRCGRVCPADPDECEFEIVWSEDAERPEQPEFTDGAHHD